MARSNKRRAKPFWWHVSEDAWSGLAPAQMGTLTNVGKDIVLILVDTEEPTGAEPVVPERDDFVVERIVGQWQIVGAQPVGRNYFVHERVYVTEATAGSVAVRDLAQFGEADTSFLYHNVSLWSDDWNNDGLGNWQNGAADQIPDIHNGGMHGPFFRDIRVGRRIQEGEALIWHLQFQGTVDPLDAEFGCKPWFRTLLRMA